MLNLPSSCEEPGIDIPFIFTIEYRASHPVDAFAFMRREDHTEQNSPG